MKLNKLISITLIVIVSVASIYGYKLYKDIFTPNTNFEQAKVYIHIPTGSTFRDVQQILIPYVEKPERIPVVAEKAEYINNVKAGRFLITKGMNTLEIIRALRVNLPKKVSFNNQETIEKFAGRIAAQIEPDSIQILKAITDPDFLKDHEINKDELLGLFIPNSYEFFWNTSPRKFANRMAREYRIFWNEKRKEKAKALGLTPKEVSTLASIVHKESAMTDERPRVAGVYLNRLKRGMKLEADPTVIYAVKRESGDFNQVIKRVLYKDLKVDSPYNTYLYKGLPPGPIAMPDISAIDAVLNPEEHKYLFFCASVTRFGYHEFAKNIYQHGVNKRKYQRWINKQKIYR